MSITKIGCKTDNCLPNLQYLTREQHARLHSTGKKLSPETKEKIKLANKGKPSPLKGKKLSDEHKEKLRAAHQKKPVFCQELNKVFESIIQAARELSLSDGHIWACCQGKRKTHGGFHFSFYTGGSK